MENKMYHMKNPYHSQHMISPFYGTTIEEEQIKQEMTSTGPVIPQGQNPSFQPQKQQEKKTFYQTIKPFLYPVAVGVAYSRTKSIPKSIGAGIVAPIYLAYVVYTMVAKKK